MEGKVLAHRNPMSIDGGSVLDFRRASRRWPPLHKGRVHPASCLLDHSFRNRDPQPPGRSAGPTLRAARALSSAFRFPAQPAVCFLLVACLDQSPIARRLTPSIGFTVRATCLRQRHGRGRARMPIPIPVRRAV